MSIHMTENPIITIWISKPDQLTARWVDIAGESHTAYKDISDDEHIGHWVTEFTFDLIDSNTLADALWILAQYGDKQWVLVRP